MENDKDTNQTKSHVSLKEEEILEFWKQKEIFKKTLEKESPEGSFVFFDGPPFATGLPHYGHILPGTIKDIIPRYQTMKGKKVLRKWGWDCHGLPVENLVEKELGLKTKKDIEVYGIDKFNQVAKKTVFRYVDEWKKIIPRTGRWVDMENDYRTINVSFTESVWWAFKELYDKNFVYKGFKSMHLCPRCETTLSNFEVNQGYKDITDISVTVELELLDEPKTFILAWTTTPWTLPGNVALAVNPDIDYVVVEGDVPGNKYILAKSRLEAVFKNNFKILKEIKGEDLIGKSYKPLFDYYSKDPNLENKENGWKIYGADFVTTEDGTGVVHIAPAFGEDDLKLGQDKKLPFIQHVKTDGTFKPEVYDFAGYHVKPIEDVQKTDVEIIKYLAKQGTLFAKEKLVHSYPHCWRCSTPLLNYATSSWFIKVSSMSQKLVDINKNIKWIPDEIGEGRFGNWLENARDWAISRSRYWGAPIPVWETPLGERVVVGSLEELKKRIGRKNNYFLMRHGESEANISGDVIWSKDFDGNPLTEKGRENAEKSARGMSGQKIDLIISSPFLRTRQTAEIAASVFGLDKSEIIIDERLGELKAGGYDGKTWGDLLANISTIEDKFGKSFDGSETWGELLSRVMNFLYDVDKKYEDKNILLVSHGSPINLMLAGSTGLSVRDIMARYVSRAIGKGEIKKCDFVSLPHNEIFETDLHRPYIDEVILRGDNGEILKRIPDVFDCWVESGSMSFAQNHYPFENKDEFESKNSPIFPADFISEGLDQTRGWFYTSLVLSAGLFDKSPYKRVVVNGLVLAEDGRKMSKSLNNFPDPMDIINKYGADALRFYLINSSLVRAGDSNFSEKGVDEVSKKLIQKIYNILSFYEMYPISKEGKIIENILDKWIISKLGELNKIVTESLDKYELDKATRPIMDFVDDLSTWYIRRSRDRFKSEDDDIKWTVSKQTSFVLRELSKILAPFVPFLAEEVYRRSGGEKESVHLEGWPEISKIDQSLISDMRVVREVVTKALEMRQKSGIKVRQPLSELKISEKSLEGKNELLEIIKDEINVKNISLYDGQIYLDTNITEELKNEGLVRDLIREIQDIRKKENLNPADRISITISSPEIIVSLIENNSEIIKSITGVVDFKFVSNSQNYEISLGEEKISLSVNR